ncbi:MAG: 16S rRNA (guanine(527)-N(7))-methyltransferase RsmG [Treponema sp.]|jgi:16S rRNA (guanine527-N7)-methyltransferase|nr:16S rRNA (guanine(527)-N(7))-methyltransferase RsmG [Treponema sp.]
MGLTLEEGLRRLADAAQWSSADWSAAGRTGAGQPAAGRLSAFIEPRLDAVSALLERYIAEIERFNPAYGLVKVKNREELVTRHILDSLAPLGIILSLLEAGGPAAQAADLGSGAGLPGIPLAIALPEFRFTLIERMGRRAGFLRNTAAVLGLENVAVEEAEMEKAAPGRFTLLCFRAFRPLEPALHKALLRLLAPGGAIAAYKGRLEAIRAELAALGPLNPDRAPASWEILPCPTPGLDEERHLLVLRHPGD